MSWVPFAVMGGIFVFKDDILNIVKGNDKVSGGERGPLCPTCASKKAGRTAIWRNKCSECSGACATLPDNKQVIDAVMQQMMGGQPKQQQQPGYYQIADDPRQGPVNLAETEGARPSMRQQMMDPQQGGQPQYTQGASMHAPPPQGPAEGGQMQGGFGGMQADIGGVPAPSTRPAVEGDAFPGANYPGPM